jgi:hypothetical protein
MVLRRRPPEPSDEIGHLADPARTRDVRRRIFEGESQADVVLELVGDANLRLAEERDRVEALEVDAVGLRLRVREGGPGLPHDERPPLAVGVAQAQRAAGAGEVGFDERTHGAHAGGRAHVEAEPAGVRRVHGPRLLARLRRARHRDRGGHESILRAQRPERVHRRRAHEPAEAEGGVGARNAEGAGELSGGNDVGRNLGDVLDGLLELGQPFLDGRRDRRRGWLLVHGLEPVVIGDGQGARLLERGPHLLELQPLLFDQAALLRHQPRQIGEGRLRGRHRPGAFLSRRPRWARKGQGKDRRAKGGGGERGSRHQPTSGRIRCRS